MSQDPDADQEHPDPKTILSDPALKAHKDLPR
jgi:hypothetical protein